MKLNISSKYLIFVFYNSFSFVVVEFALHISFKFHIPKMNRFDMHRFVSIITEFIPSFVVRKIRET